MMARFSSAELVVLVSVTVLLAPTMVQAWCNPDTGEGCEIPTGDELNVGTIPEEPFIKPCANVTRCSRLASHSWWYCIASTGCKEKGPFSTIDCPGDQCTFSPAASSATTVHAYKFGGIGGEANRPPQYTQFFIVPAGQVEKVCIESCDGASRGFNELDSLRNHYNDSATLQLYEVIDANFDAGISEGRGRYVAGLQGFTVRKQTLPAICFKRIDFTDTDNEEFYEQQSVCQGSFPASKCTRTCYDNTDNNLDLVPGDRVAAVFRVYGQYGDHGSVRNVVISVYSRNA